MTRTRFSILSIALAAALATAAVSHAEEPPDSGDGFHLTPRVQWKHGDHSITLPFESRYRYENWKAFTNRWDGFHGFRTRFGAEYRYKQLFRLVAQGQHTAVFDLGNDASGTGALYRSNSPTGSRNKVSSTRLSQLFAEVRPAEGSWLRGGRQSMTMGTTVPYEEADWRFLKSNRIAQRLLGGVGWTHGERAYDGVNARGQWNGHALHALVAQPTTGVFDIDDAYERQKDVIVGGVEYTLLRGTWRDDTELGAFFMGYDDGRDPRRVAGLFGDITVYTLGLSWLGVYDVGPGRLDTVLWGAFQFGDYRDSGPTNGVRHRDQRAGALIAEVGYQLPEVWAKPWLRLGVNWASGDDDLDDNTRSTFFNLLPTNHLYYGYQDQLAFQNLVDLLVQFRASPHEKLSVDLTYHRFWLQEGRDFRWSGSGAFTRRNLGFVRNASSGSRNVGHELDLTLEVPVHRTTTIQAGYSHFWGGRVFGLDDADWMYAQVLFKY